MIQRTGPEIPASLTINIDQKDGVWIVTCPELNLVDAHTERIEASYSRMGQLIAAHLMAGGRPPTDAFDKCRNLEKGWDGYDAEAPTPASILNARLLLVVFSYTDPRLAASKASRIRPSVVGGVGVTYRFGTREVYVEISNDGGIHYIMSDTADIDHPQTGEILNYRDSKYPQMFARFLWSDQ